ncbi:tyrosine-type recombinase/integrase [Vibrio sp. TRT 1302]|uniref:tyrosine-type recombinase/integrase n=1 Tax=Vibrio sp. TRT 1302 TaxID=3418504 RepID=UPI003CEDC81C
MNYIKLTQQKIKSLLPQSKTYTVWDTKQYGFGVRVGKDTSRFYVIKTDGGNKIVAPVGSLSLSQARQKSLSLMQRKGRAVGARRFDVLVQDEWLDNVCSTWKPSSQKGARGALNKHLLPAFGRYPVTRIGSCHVQRWFDELSQDYAGAANRTLDVLRSIFNYAERQGYCLNNPCDGIKQNRKKKLNRFLSLDELSRLEDALRAVSQQGKIEACCCQVIKLVLLTGCRISEVTGLQWSFVKGDEWHLPDSKTGAKVVYVGKGARKLLLQIGKQFFDVNADLDDVFPPLRCYVSRPTKVTMIWQRVRVLADIADVRIHDLRHTFASYAVLEGYPLPMVAKLLGHKRISSTLRYMHVSECHVTEAAEFMGTVITGVLTESKDVKPKKRKHTTKALKADNPNAKPKVRKGVLSTSPELTDKQVSDIRAELDFLSW